MVLERHNYQFQEFVSADGQKCCVRLAAVVKIVQDRDTKCSWLYLSGHDASFKVGTPYEDVLKLFDRE